MEISLKKISFYMLVVIFSLFSFTTLTYDFYPIINRLLGIVIVGLILVTYLLTIKKRDLIIVLFILFVGLNGVMYDVSNSYNDAMYFVITLLLVWKLTDEDFMNYFSNSIIILKKFIFFVLLLNISIIFIGLFLNQCYEIVWYDRYFLLFAYSSHSLSCSICITLILVLFCSKELKYDLVKIAIFSLLSFALFQTGARTYVIAAVILWIYLFKYDIKNKNLKFIILPIMVFAFIFILLNSNFVQKNDYASNDSYTSDNSLISFSSGRIKFWSIDINEYFKYDFIKKLFGSGFGSIYDINENLYGRRIWGHNDLINTLVCNGIVGLVLYVFVFCNVLIKVFKKNKFDCLLLFIYITFTCFFNGVFKYQHYVYSIVFFYSIMYIKNMRIVESDVKEKVFMKNEILTSIKNDDLRSFYE